MGEVQKTLSYCFLIWQRKAVNSCGRVYRRNGKKKKLVMKQHGECY